MHLRKSLALAAAVVTAGLVGVTCTAAYAAPSYIGVNGSTASGTAAIDGIFWSGNASFAGSTYGCTSGSDAGTVIRGPVSATADISFTSLSMSCSLPVGTMTISINSGCSVPVDFPGATVTDGVDTAVTGTAAMGSGSCVKVSGLGGLCTANAQGTISATFNETVRSIGGVNYQDLIYNGSATLANQSGCLGLLSGNFTLNNIDFAIKVAGGSTSSIDFRVNP